MAIRANELRIGNVFTREVRSQRGLEYDHDFVLTEEWMGKLFGNDISISLQDLFPIPLTPEILERLGFKSNRTDDNDEFYTLQITDDLYNPLAFISTLVFDEECPVCLFPNKSGKDCKYLHQLQNLYFALTGTELEITLDNKQKT